MTCLSLMGISMYILVSYTCVAIYQALIKIDLGIRQLPIHFTEGGREHANCLGLRIFGRFPSDITPGRPDDIETSGGESCDDGEDDHTNTSVVSGALPTRSRSTSVQPAGSSPQPLLSRESTPRSLTPPITTSTTQLTRSLLTITLSRVPYIWELDWAPVYSTPRTLILSQLPSAVYDLAVPLSVRGSKLSVAGGPTVAELAAKYKEMIEDACVHGEFTKILRPTRDRRFHM